MATLKELISTAEHLIASGGNCNGVSCSNCPASRQYNPGGKGCCRNAFYTKDPEASEEEYRNAFLAACARFVRKNKHKIDSEKEVTAHNVEPNNVDHPQHYGGDTTYEAIKVIEACGWGKGFCLGNAIKYIMRSDKKGKEKEELDAIERMLALNVCNKEKSEYVKIWKELMDECKKKKKLT